MEICTQILTRVEAVIILVITVIKTIVETVCNWVTTIIRTVKEVVKKVCKWLPWPINKVCDLVTKLVEVVERITEWVCEEILIRIIRYIEIAVRYIIYILRWVCWVIDWPIRFIFGILPCLIEEESSATTVTIPLCIKLLVNQEGRPAITLDRLSELIEGTRNRLEQCKIELCIISVDIITQPDSIEAYQCGASGLFSRFHLWFQANKCDSWDRSVTTVTAFFVPQFEGFKGCAIPRTDYVVIGADASLATLAHELGHHADLTHRDTLNNLMETPTSDNSINLTKWQCCLFRTARFATRSLPTACRWRLVSEELISGLGSINN